MKRSEGGGTLVEAAAVVLLLFTFIFAIIEFGRVMSVYQTITNATREGARFGVAPCQSGDTAQTSCSYAGTPFQDGTTSDAAISAVVTNYLNAGAVTPTAINITHQFQTLSGSTVTYRYLTVQVKTNYQWMIFPFGTLPLQAQSVMKEEIDLAP